jgi:predicted dehydrogenase
MGDSIRVLIVGCGELGSRHLQAVAALPLVREIEIVEPSKDAVQIGQRRLAEVSDRHPGISCRWLSALDEATPGGDLCIVATRADVRCRIVGEVVAKLSYTRFLLEKLVSQTVAEYENLRILAQQQSLRIWVNCKTRTHASHQRVKKHLDEGEPIILSAIGGNHGLANNGVHAADLFAFYDGADHIDLAGGRIDAKLHPTKRGNSILDLSGTLVGTTVKGSQFLLSYAASYESPGCFSIVSPSYRAVVDDTKKFFYESSADNGWRWDHVPFDANLMVSHMTRSFVTDILSHENCILPTLDECFPAHRFILDALLPHFRQLAGSHVDRCPVT